MRNFVCVADDVFRDGMEFDDVTEAWRRALANVLRSFAARADTVLEVSCGLVKPHKGSLPPLGEEK